MFMRVKFSKHFVQGTGFSAAQLTCSKAAASGGSCQTPTAGDSTATATQGVQPSSQDHLSAPVDVCSSCVRGTGSTDRAHPLQAPSSSTASQ